MITVEIHPDSIIHQTEKLRATELESYINDPFRPSVPEVERQETMSIGDVLHSYIQHLKLEKDLCDEREGELTDIHYKALRAVTDREIELHKYRDLAIENLPSFKVVEQSYKIRVLHKGVQVFFSGTVDAIPTTENMIIDLKISGKNRAKQRREQAKQKIYYTYLHSLVTDNREEKEFVYAIFTTKESKPRCILHSYKLDPRECEAIFKEDISRRIDGKEKKVRLQHVTSPNFI